MKNKQLLINIAFGVLLLVGWGAFNYNNYVDSQNKATVLIEQNVEMVDNGIKQVEDEQLMYRNVQKIFIPEPSVDPNTSTPETRIVSDLDRRINKLEEEKTELKKERNYVIETIQAMHNIFFRTDVNNPIINLIFIPVFVYFFKKCIDLWFKILAKRYNVA